MGCAIEKANDCQDVEHDVKRRWDSAKSELDGGSGRWISVGEVDVNFEFVAGNGSRLEAMRFRMAETKTRESFRTGRKERLL